MSLTNKRKKVLIKGNDYCIFSKRRLQTNPTKERMCYEEIPHHPLHHRFSSLLSRL